jgi:glycosyltransferase involved in cell wall biosynthesis
MRILFCVEFYYPSIGGAQEVIRRISENFVNRGVQVHVATSALSNRVDNIHNGVIVHDFKISGNLVSGLIGDLDAYNNFLLGYKFDAIFFYAAQQWTFDAAWPLIGRLNGKKYLVPCGYSGLNKSEYKKYFQDLPGILNMMDGVIYHSQSYQDFEYSVSNKIGNEIFIPNGADIDEFSCPINSNFKKQLCIDSDRKVIMSVGSLDPNKGFSEILKALYSVRSKLENVTVVINGNFPADKRLVTSNNISSIDQQRSNHKFSFFEIMSALRKKLHFVLNYFGIQYQYLQFLKLCRFNVELNDLNHWIEKINKSKINIDVRVLNLNRSDLIQLYLNSDLFVFASKIEYSPLVLFEACAAGLPFLSVNAGNAHEIAAWTGGGDVCNFQKDSSGALQIKANKLGIHILNLLQDQQKLDGFSARGKYAIYHEFNWNLIHEKYADLILHQSSKSSREPFSF